MYARVCAHGTDSSEGVIPPNSFESVLRIDTFEGVHACTCMCTVKTISHLMVVNWKMMSGETIGVVVCSFVLIYYKLLNNLLIS